MLARIFPLESSHDTFGLTYSIPLRLMSSIDRGQLVRIPIRDTLCLGIVADIQEHSEGIDTSALKEIYEIIEYTPVLSPSQIQTIESISHKQLIHIHKVASLFFPRPLQKRIENYAKKGTPILTGTSSGITVKEKIVPTLHFVKTPELLFPQIESLKKDKTIFIVPSDRFLPIEENENIGVLKSEATDAYKTKFWIRLKC
jgi:primosomal protein N'